MATETFILRFLSPETGCSCHELRFEAEPQDIAGILDVGLEDLARQSHYPDTAELAALAKLLKLPLPDWDGDITLSQPHWLDRVPYLIHTNFELPLMLDGRKPFAVMSGEKDFHGFEAMRTCFKPHVDHGTIVEKVTEWQARSTTIVTAYYALPGEEWRFEAYDLLMNGPRPWTDEMEHRLGMLLGYTEEQCDWWIANRPGRVPFATDA